ncbi:hypothetical protein LCGC14_0316600 [marine sediment metagenome]|uniref:Uncharacterized protein n=1 Tax=marine sediment metagenome TaxID=412755 RepID=A0A0F9WSH0_9ZZZZ
MKALTPNQLLAWKAPARRYIISNGILIPESRCIIFGEPETYKSMLTIDIAFRIANGLPWLGFKTIATPVYILQCEIAQSALQARIQKYMIGNRISSEDVWLWTNNDITLDRGPGLSELAMELNESNPGVLILDPAYSLISGNATQTYDVDLLLKRINTLINTYRLAVILIHHSKKPEHVEGVTYHYGAHDMNGPTYHKWCDTAIELRKIDDGGNIMMSFEKLRNNEEGTKPKPFPIHFNSGSLEVTKIPTGVE